MLFGELSQDQAIALLKTPWQDLENPTDRYHAASHLAHFPGDRTVQALIELVEETHPSLEQRIARRKAIESLGRLKAAVALEILHRCLADPDPYTVENAVWAIGEIGSEDAALLDAIAQLLQCPSQNHRVVLQTLTKLHYTPSLAQVRPFIQSENALVACAALGAVYRFTADPDCLDRLITFLFHSQVQHRRGAIEDLRNAQAYDAIAAIATCPVSITFRLRGIRYLADQGIAAQQLTAAQVQPYLDQVIRDHPDNLKLVHIFPSDPPPDLPFLIQGLYHSDGGYCYAATQSLLQRYAGTAGPTLLTIASQWAEGDYGAHYHVIKLLGWLKLAESHDLLVEVLHQAPPQFYKSRLAAAIALGELEDSRGFQELRLNLEFGRRGFGVQVG
jgi:bilin biosynthesis protein